MINDPSLLDVVDDSWREDSLPDDDISLPEGVQPPGEEGEDVGEDGQNSFNAPEKWKELGLNTVR